MTTELQESVTITTEESVKTSAVTTEQTENAPEIVVEPQPDIAAEPVPASAPEPVKDDGAATATEAEAVTAVPPPPPGMVKSATLILKTTEVGRRPHVDTAQADFAVRLLRELFETEAESFAVSPLGIAQQLTALEAGSFGETKKELISALPIEKSLGARLIERLPLVKPKDPDAKDLEKLFEALRASDFPNVHLANTIFLQEGFLVLSAYKTYLDKHRLGEVRFTNFNNPSIAVQDINDTITGATRREVEDPVEAAQIPENAKLFALSTAYVKSQWPKKFIRKPSGPSLTYHSSETKKHDIYFLTGGGDFLYTENDKLKVIGLPFGGSDDALTLYCIASKKKFGIKKALGKLDGSRLAELLGECKKTSLNLAIPHFKLKKTVNLATLLNRLGVEAPFDKRANFYGISESGRSHVVAAPHNVYFEVSEGPSRTQYDDTWATKDVIFEANSPFLYLLVNKQGGVVIAGVYISPQPGVDEKPPLPVEDTWTDTETTNVALKPQTSLSFSKVTRAQADFALKLISEKVSPETKASAALSPISVAILLALCAEGAHSETLRQILAVISNGVSLRKVRSYYSEALGRLRSANDENKGQKVQATWRAFVENTRTFLLSFTEVVEQNYPNVFQKIDFSDAEQAAKDINEIIAVDTDNLVSDIVTPASVLENSILLVSATGFQAKWHTRFEAQDTRKSKFNSTATDTVEVDMLFKEDDYLYNANNEFEVVTLPYESEQFFLSVFLPRKKCGLYDELPKLNGYELLKLIHETFYKGLKLFLPKFKVETTTLVKPLLESVGLQEAFKHTSADFSGTSSYEHKTFVGDVLEKVVFQVGEEGTASLTSSGEITTTTAGAAPTPAVQKPVFQADHPFLYTITDSVGNIVLAGVFHG